MSIKLTDVFETTSGKIRGYFEDDDVMVFKGVPYAAPPVGDLRFKRAIPYEPKEGVLDCLEFGPSCHQNFMDDASKRIWTEEFVITNKNLTEDCLTLNIWAKKGGSGMPVVLYFYGGGFVSGGSSCEIYDGHPFAMKDVVYVTFTHREAAFAWFVNDEIDSEMSEGASGNYMISDADIVLNWIRDNAEKFGGDPENVTIWGQSSGGAEVNLISASDRLLPFLSKTVSMGYNCYPEKNAYRWDSKEEAKEKGRPLMEAYGSLEAIRKVPGEDLKSHSYINRPVIDDYYAKDYYRNLVNKGIGSDHPFMMGMANEDFIVSPLFTQIRAEQTIEGAVNSLRMFYPETAEKIVEAYNINEENRQVTIRQMFDDIMKYQLLIFARARVKTGSADTYLYIFKHIMPGPDSQLFGAFHSSEIPYCTGHLSELRRDYWTDKDRTMAKKMNQMLVGFFRDGKPDMEDFVPSDGTNIFIIDTDRQYNEVFPQDKIDLWDELFG